MDEEVQPLLRFLRPQVPSDEAQAGVHAQELPPILICAFCAWKTVGTYLIQQGVLPCLTVPA